MADGDPRIGNCLRILMVWRVLSLSVRQEAPPRLPDGTRIYAIGDIHGCADLVEQLFARIDEDLRRRPISRALHVFLGDYIDRGKDSRHVLDLLISRSRLHDTIFLKGNHEVFLVDFLHNPASFDFWRRFGASETLTSYGLCLPSPGQENSNELSATLNRLLPSSHKGFLSQLRTSFTCGDFFFVHAGIKPGIALEKQREQDLLWIRDEFLLYEQEFEKFIVHGHSPVKEPDIRLNRINIDTGAYATGRLTCLKIEGDTLLVSA